MCVSLPEKHYLPLSSNNYVRGFRTEVLGVRNELWLGLLTEDHLNLQTCTSFMAWATSTVRILFAPFSQVRAEVTQHFLCVCMRKQFHNYTKCRTGVDTQKRYSKISLCACVSVRFKQIGVDTDHWNPTVRRASNTARICAPCQR